MSSFKRFSWYTFITESTRKFEFWTLYIYMSIHRHFFHPFLTIITRSIFTVYLLMALNFGERVDFWAVWKVTASDVNFLEYKWEFERLCNGFELFVSSFDFLLAITALNFAFLPPHNTRLTVDGVVTDGAVNGYLRLRQDYILANYACYVTKYAHIVHFFPISYPIFDRKFWCFEKSESCIGQSWWPIISHIFSTNIIRVLFQLFVRLFLFLLLLYNLLFLTNTWHL